MVAFANLAQLHFIDKEVQHALRDALNDSFPNLVGLVSRLKERAFPDWEEICAPEVPPPPAKKEKETKEGTGPNEKQPLPDEPEKGKVCNTINQLINSNYKLKSYSNDIENYRVTKKKRN